MKKLLIISFSDVQSDPRVQRQIRLLRQYYRVTAIGFGSCPADGIVWHSIRLPLRSLVSRLKNISLLITRQFERAYWNKEANRIALQLLDGKKFDVVIANDIYALPLALRVANDTPVLLDAHEYAPLEHEDNVVWRLYMQPYVSYLCKAYLHRAAAMTTVCEGLARQYERAFRFKPKIITNAPTYQTLVPSEIDNKHIRLIHHGGAIPGRHLELMIEMMNYLDERFTMDFMLMPSNPGYLLKLKKLASVNKRIRFLEPVSMLNISKTINKYDVGVYILKPNNFNNANALPNKIFEFVQARLGVAIGPSPEMTRVVEQYKLGVVAEDFNPMTLARKLNTLTREQIVHFKANAHAAASELCFEKNAEILLNEIKQLECPVLN